MESQIKSSAEEKASQLAALSSLPISYNENKLYRSLSTMRQWIRCLGGSRPPNISTLEDVDGLFYLKESQKRALQILVKAHPNWQGK